MPNPSAVNSMFARIAHRYDVANRLLSMGIDLWWRKRLVKAVLRTRPKDILDLATGSGDVVFALSCKALSTNTIVGMDFCQPMLDVAKAKLQNVGSTGNPIISFQQGDGMNLPLHDHSFDAVTISFGLRNMGDRHKSLCEMRRVLRPGGRIYVLEFSQPNRWFRPIYLFYLRHILPFIAGIITQDKAAYVYLNESIELFPDRAALTDEIEAAGFKHVTSTGLTFGVVALHEASV
jgi:demethylmenaquinone methyltransferase / 2-methoxy-6-polyprenyl-1,4-benzoquinol methylase